MAPASNLMWQPDQQVVAAALAGSQAAYTELVRRYEGPIVRTIYLIVPHTQRAEDLTQETLAKAFQHLDRYDPNRPFGPWILAIARNVARDYYRRVLCDSWGSPLLDDSGRLEEVAILPPALTDTPIPDHRRRAIIDMFDYALNRLRPEYRICVELLIEGHTYREIAKIRRLPYGTVATYIRRGREQLTEFLAPWIGSSDSDPAISPV